MSDEIKPVEPTTSFIDTIFGIIADAIVLLVTAWMFKTGWDISIPELTNTHVGIISYGASFGITMMIFTIKFLLESTRSFKKEKPMFGNLVVQSLDQKKEDVKDVH